jgi:hypothetical protein
MDEMGLCECEDVDVGCAHEWKQLYLLAV